jgi:hypothetical protein
MMTDNPSRRVRLARLAGCLPRARKQPAPDSCRRRHVPWSVRTAAAATVFAAVLGTPNASSDPLALYAPASFSQPKTRATVDAGAAVVDVLPAGGHDVAVFGAVRVRIDGDRLVAWVRQIEDFQKGPHAPLAVRLSSPPRIEDLDSLVLGTADLEDLRRCRPNDCGLKLGAGEIEALRRVMSRSGADWQASAQVQFRQIVLERALRYLADGYDKTPSYDDHDQSISAGAEFKAVLANLRRASFHEPRLTEYLEQYPRAIRSDVESFLYWSKEVPGSGKPIISLTEVAIVRGAHPGPFDALIASKQIFASHYVSGSVSLLGVTTPSARGHRYLLYTRHSRVDLFEGILGRMVRGIVEKRIKSDAPTVLDGIRCKLESGEPPAIALAR